MDAEIKALAPDVQEYWFFWRPVVQGICTFSEMWVEEKYTFEEINSMHELLDFKFYAENCQDPKGEK